MAGTRREDELRFRFTLAESDLQKLKQGTRDVQREIDRIAGAAREAFDSDPAAKFRKQIGDTTKELAEMRAEMLRGVKVRQEFDQANNNRTRLSSSAGINSLAQVAGVASPAAGSILRDLGDLQQAREQFGGVGTVIAAGGVIAGAAAIAFAQMNKDLEAVRAEVEAATQVNRDYYRVIASGQTTEQVQKNLDELIRLRDAEAQSLADQQNAQAMAFADAQRTYGDAAARALFAIGNVGASTAETEKALTEYNAKIAEHQRLLESGALAANDAAAAQRSYNDELIRSFRSNLSIQQQVADLAATGTAEQVQNRIDALNREAQVIRDWLPLLQDYINAAVDGSDEQKKLQAEFNQLNNRLTELDATTAQLAGTALEAARAHDAEIAAMRESAEVRKNTVAAVERYNTEIARLEEQSQADRLAINDKYLNAVTDAVTKAADSAEATLRKLQDQRAALDLRLQRDGEDSGIEAERDRLDAEIELQREEAKAWRSHQADLARIRKQGFRDEQTAIANRDAVSLYNARQKTKDAIDEANDQFTQERRERLISYQQQLADLDRAQDREREDRIRAYRRALTDANTAYTAELRLNQDRLTKNLQLAAAARDRELGLAANKYQTELAMRTSAIKAELDLITRGNAARLALENQLIQQSLALRGAAVYPQPAPSINTPGYFSSPPSWLTSGAGSSGTSPFSRSTSQSMTLSPAFNMQGVGRSQLTREFNSMLGQFLDQAGIR